MDSSANLFVTEQEQATFRCADMHSNSTKGMQFSFKKAPKSKRSSENRKQRLQVKEDVPEDDEQITVYQRTQHLDRDYTPTRPIEASPSSEEPVCPSGRKKVGHGVPKAPNLSAANLQLGNSKENICPASKSKKSPMKKQTQPNVNKSTPFGATDDSFARSRSNLKHLSSQSTQQDASSSHHQSPDHEILDRIDDLILGPGVPGFALHPHFQAGRPTIVGIELLDIAWPAHGIASCCVERCLVHYRRLQS